MDKLFFIALSLSISTFTYSQSSPDAFYEDASRLYHSQDYPAAIIQLKNALQLNPEHVPSLVLTAETYIAQDKSAAAEEVLIKARVLGADRRFINLNLAEVYRRQGKYQSILDEISTRNIPPKIAADILGYKAIAWLSLGKNSNAQDLVDQSESILPTTSFRTYIAKVLIAISQRDFDTSISLGRELTQKFPQRSESWNTYASALHASGQLRSAYTAYEKAIVVSPVYVDARVSKAALALDLERFEKADEDLEYLKKNFPYEPRAAYLRALLHTRVKGEDYAQKSFSELKTCTEIIARLPQDRVSGDKQLPMVAAQAHYGLSEFESSKGYLSLYLKKNSQDPGANRLMGDILLKLNDPVTAIRFLKPALQRHPNDVQVISLLATAYSKAGHHEKATQLLENLQARDLSNTDLEDRLAITLLQAGHNESGITQLSSAFMSTNNNTQSGFQLVIALLKNKRYTEALTHAITLAKEAPDNIAFQNILGITQLSTGDIESARKTFEAILEKQPNSISTTINLAKLESSAGNTERALKLLKSTINENPESSQAMLALARLELSSGNTDKALKHAETARILDIENIDIRLFLMELYLLVGQNENAVTLALDTNILAKNSFESSITLARVYQRANQPRKALAIYKQQTKALGFHTERLYLLAQIMIELKAYPDARHALFKAIEGNPRHLPSRVSFVSLLLQMGEYDAAKEQANQLVTIYPEEAISYLMLADSETRLNNPKAASVSYAKGLSLSFMPELALGLSHSQSLLNKPEKSLKTLQSYWQKHPAIGAAYSIRLIEEQEFLTAKSTLEVLIDSTADNASHLNNMAYVLDELGSKSALEYAQRAHNAAPANPYINDTIGWLMVKAGKPEQGLKYLRQAVVRASDVPEIRYHIGKALLDLGRKAEAKRELEAAVDSGESFNGIADAKALLNSLG